MRERVMAIVVCSGLAFVWYLGYRTGKDAERLEQLRQRQRAAPAEVERLLPYPHIPAVAPASADRSA